MLQTIIVIFLQHPKIGTFVMCMLVPNGPCGWPTTTATHSYVCHQPGSQRLFAATRAELFSIAIRKDWFLSAPNIDASFFCHFEVLSMKFLLDATTITSMHSRRCARSIKTLMKSLGAVLVENDRQV